MGVTGDNVLEDLRVRSGHRDRHGRRDGSFVPIESRPRDPRREFRHGPEFGPVPRGSYRQWLARRERAPVRAAAAFDFAVHRARDSDPVVDLVPLRVGAVLIVAGSGAHARLDSRGSQHILQPVLGALRGALLGSRRYSDHGSGGNSIAAGGKEAERALTRRAPL